MNQTEPRPAWWRIALGAWAGFMAGALIGGWLVNGVFYAIDAAVGRDGGGPPDFESIKWYDFLAMYLLWGVIFALMQFFAARASGWTKTVWIEAGLQTAALLLFTVIGGAGFMPGIAIPWVVAFLLLRKSSLPALIGRDRARRAARFPRS